VSAAQLRRSLLDLRWTVLWYSAGVAAYGMIIAAFWPAMQKNAEIFQQYIKQFPEAFTKAFGIEEMMSFAGFLGGEMLNFMWPLVISIFLVMTASAAVAGEIDRGTVELWLSAPVARWRLLAAKSLALFAGIVVIVAATVASIALAALLAGETLSAAGLAWCGAALLSFSVAVAGYGLLLSSMVSSRGLAAGLAAAVTLVSYLAGVVSALSADVEWLKYVAITSAFHPQQALLDRAAPGEIALLVGIGVASTLAALIAFERRDASP